jgi:O-antigen/teichoic acid export membrane protein
MWQKVKSFLLHNTSTRQTVAKNTFWLSVSNFGGRLIRAGIIIYAARILGAHGWGIFNYGVTLVAFLTTFSDIGINSILTRETAKEAGGAQRAEILSTSFIIKLILIVLGVVVIFFVAPHFSRSSEVSAIIPLVAFIFIFDTLREFGFSLTRAMEKMEWEAALFTLTNIAILVAGFIFLKVSPTVNSFALAYALGTGIGAIATLITLRQQFKSAFTHFSRKLIRPIFTSAWPFAISGILGALMINMDVLLIGIFKSAEDVGYYSAANRVIQVIYILPTIIALSVLPIFSRLARQEVNQMQPILEKVLGFLLACALPITIGGIILGRPLVELLFGAGYLQAVSSFQVLCITLLINFCAIILANVIFSYDKQKSLIAYAAIGGFVNVALDLVLIPRFGIVGSAWATLIAQFLSNAYLWRKTKSIVSFKIAPHLKRVIPASVAMGVATYYFNSLHTPVLINIILSGAIYAFLLFVLKEPLIKDITLLSSQNFSSRIGTKTDTF